MASSALAASMEGGLEPNSQNSAQLKSWSLTLSPRRTERPFIFRSGSPISSSLPFSWQSSTILPKWTILPVCCASLRTADASRTLPSSQAPVPFVGNGRLRNRSFSHSASKALRALGQDSISLRDNLRAIQHGACQAFFVAMWFLFVGLIISWEPRNRVEKDRGRGAARGGGGGEFFFILSYRLSLFFGV